MTQKEAANALKTQAAGEIEPDEILLQDDEERKFAELQQRAARAGATLMATATGYVLVQRSSSHHSSSLDAIAHVLARRGVQQ